VPNCIRKHIQKLHELLKDVFQEENQVHLVHGDDGWEESEEAWEVDGEEEMMIVGTIQREDNYSWQDASKSWLEQDEEEEDGTYYVGTCQGTSGVPPEAREKQCSTVVCPPTEEYENAETEEGSWWTPGPEDLLIEGEEREYFLKLLMREEASEKPPTAAAKGASRSRRGQPRETKQPPAGQEEGQWEDPQKGKWGDCPAGEEGGQCTEGRGACGRPTRRAGAGDAT
jgi:hypothetical protein